MIDDTYWDRLRRGMCPNCGERGPHFVPPSFGDPGFFHCTKREEWLPLPLPLHRTEAGYPNCSTCDGGGCPDCTDPA